MGKNELCLGGWHVRLMVWRVFLLVWVTRCSVKKRCAFAIRRGYLEHTWHPPLLSVSAPALWTVRSYIVYPVPRRTWLL
jgi:hypothetical protein